jgi:hypothetical protein
MLLGQIPLTFNLTLFWLMAIGPVFAYALSQRHLHRDWARHMAYMPVLALLGTGLALSNTMAIARGLLGRGLPFRRTPKFHVQGRGDRWADSRYALPFEWITLGELALAVYGLVASGTAVAVGSYFAVPFLLLYVGGYGYMAWCGLRDVRIRRNSRPPLPQARAVAVAGQWRVTRTAWTAAGEEEQRTGKPDDAAYGESQADARPVGEAGAQQRGAKRHNVDQCRIEGDIRGPLFSRADGQHDVKESQVASCPSQAA